MMMVEVKVVIHWFLMMEKVFIEVFLEEELITNPLFNSSSSNQELKPI